MEIKQMTYRERLREVADENYGYVTTADLQPLGIPAVELRKLANRGKLLHIRRGVYRFPGTHPTERDAFATALAAVGPDAYLVRDAVLALHGLAFVNPTKIRVATPRRVRHEVPDFVKIEQTGPNTDQLKTYEGLRTTTVARAILDSRGLVLPERLEEALRDAREQGLVSKKEFQEVRKVMRAGRKNYVSNTAA